VISVDDQREELSRIEAEPREAAVGYLKLLRQHQKELQILNGTHEKL